MWQVEKMYVIHSSDKHQDIVQAKTTKRAAEIYLKNRGLKNKKLVAIKINSRKIVGKLYLTVSNYTPKNGMGRTTMYEVV